MSVYYQFILAVKGGLPMTMSTKYQSHEKALIILERYKRHGQKGCLVEIEKDVEDGEQLLSTEIF